MNRRREGRDSRTERSIPVKWMDSPVNSPMTMPVRKVMSP